MLSISIKDYLRQVSGVCLFICLILAIWYCCLYAGLPSLLIDHRPPITIEWPTVSVQSTSFEGAVFKKRPIELATVSLGPLAKRFRLAGTFFAIGNNQQSRKAIIDDLQRKEQQLVAEGDMLDQAVKVVSIFPERIILREGNRDEELRLSFAGDRPMVSGSAQSAKGIAASSDMLNRFGKRVGEKRWVLKRDALLNYYQELLNNTDRLAKVFASLKPVYKDTKIAGYVLDVEGEADMFNAFGLKQNDIIRQVNSMPMVSQARAEYFIREFVNDRVNGFVLDIEREGKPEKMIYLIR